MRNITAAFGGIPLVIIALAFGVLLLRWRRMERWGRWWLTALAVAAWILATLPAPLLLASVLARGYQPLEPGDVPGGATTVVVLSGGSSSVVGRDRTVGLLTRETMARVVEGVRVFQMVPDARVVATGPIDESDEGTSSMVGAIVMRSALEELGVPADRVLMETEGRNTHEQAVKVAALLRRRGIDRVILVTSGFHMPRAAACFRAAGLTTIPAASGSPSAEAPAADYVVPNLGALQLSQWVLHEYIGIGYYRVRGWMR